MKVESGKDDLNFWLGGSYFQTEGFEMCKGEGVETQKYTTCLRLPLFCSRTGIL